jgi:hypothetical protein
MKKNVALGIALIVLGGLGLVYPPKFQSPSKQQVTAKHAQVVPLQLDGKTVVSKDEPVNSADAKAVLCSRTRNVSANPNLLEKMSLALADLDSIVRLQAIVFGI